MTYKMIGWFLVILACIALKFNYENSDTKITFCNAVAIIIMVLRLIIY